MHKVPTPTQASWLDIKQRTGVLASGLLGMSTRWSPMAVQELLLLRGMWKGGGAIVRESSVYGIQTEMWPPLSSRADKVWDCLVWL